MNKTNKFLIIGTFIVSVLATRMVINNNVSHNEIETGGNQLTSQEDNSPKSSRSFDSSNHGSVDFGTATPVIDVPGIGDVEVVVNSFIEGTAAGLSEEMALVIYPTTTVEDGKGEYLGYVETTTTELAGGATLTIEASIGPLLDGVEYKIYAAREKSNLSEWDILNATHATFVHQPKNNVEITSIVGTPIDASYDGIDGKIGVAIGLNCKGSTIIGVDVSLDSAGIGWTPVTTFDQTSASYEYTGLNVGDYTVFVKVTTDLGDVVGNSDLITVGETAGVDATISKPTGTSKNASYGNSDGSIDMTAIITPGDATISTVEYQVDGGAITDVGSIESNVSFNIPNLAKGDYTITIIVTTDLGRPTGISNPITVGHDQEIIPIVNPEGSTTTPTENPDGTITYLDDSITTVITTENDLFDPTLIDATNVQYEIVDNNGISFEPPILADASYDDVTGTFSLKGELTIDAATVNSGYSIVLIGVTYNSVKVPNINVETIGADSIEPMGIALIIFASLLGVGVLGSGSVLVIAKIIQYNQGRHKDKEKPNSRKSSYSKREDYGIKYENKK